MPANENEKKIAGALMAWFDEWALPPNHRVEDYISSVEKNTQFVNYETSPFIPDKTKKSIMESLDTWWSEAFSDLQDALVTAGFHIDLSDIKTTYKRSRETFSNVDAIVVSDTVTPLVDLREHGTKNTLRPAQTFTTITKLIIRYRRGSVVPKR